MYATLMYCLRLVKMFHDIGIYEKAAGDIQEISEDDYYELALRGLEYVAPVHSVEELGEDVCCGGHVMYHFSDPALLEYYRLCRLYEYKHAITPDENPYVKKADDYYIRCINHTDGDFGTNFDNQEHPREIWIETCPERYTCEYALIELVYGVLEFYRNEVKSLQAELMKGPMVWLPALPASQQKPARPKKPRAEKSSVLRKAS